jgi:hypothetical protein
MVGKLGWAAVVSAVAVGVAVSLPAQAEASTATHTPAPASAGTAPHAIGHEISWTHGIPSTAKRGQTITFTLWCNQNSPDRMEVWDYDLSVGNLANPGMGQLKGLTLSFLNPLTDRWQKPAYADQNGTLEFELGGRGVILPPKWSGHVDMRITFGASARLGTWTIDPAAGSYTLINAHGVDDPNFVWSNSEEYSLTLRR